MGHWHLITHGEGEANGLGTDVLGKEQPRSSGAAVQKGVVCVGVGAQSQAKGSRPLHKDLRQVLMFSVPGFLFCKLGLEILFLRVLLVSRVAGTGLEFGNQHLSHYILVVKVPTVSVAELQRVSREQWREPFCFSFTLMG